jgi:hypothetical protein
VAYFVLVAAISTTLGGCFALDMFCASSSHAGRLLPTIDGPEEPALLTGTSGTLVVLDHQDSHHIEVVSFPDLERHRIHIDGEPFTISGPDDQGRVVCLEADEWKGLHRRPTYLLRVVSLWNGKECTRFERPGDLSLGSSITLAPVGGHVALIRSFVLDGDKTTESTLEVIDISSGRSTTVAGEITYARWFPDGRHLAIVERRSSDCVPVTSVLDLENGERRILRDGGVRGVGHDGASLWFGGADGLCRVDVSTGKVLEMGLRLKGCLGSDPEGDPGYLVADLGDGKVLYDALPTTGADQAIVVLGWESLAKWTIKLCDDRTGAFVTVVPHIWGKADYGRVDFTAVTAAR